MQLRGKKIKAILLLLVMATVGVSINNDHAVRVKAAVPSVEIYDSMINAHKAHQSARESGNITLTLKRRKCGLQEARTAIRICSDEAPAKKGGKYVRKGIMT